MPFFTLSIIDGVFTRSHGGVWDMFWTCCVLLIAFMYTRPWSRRPAQVADHPPKAELGLQILHDHKEANIDIVAVHGLGANPDYAWVWLPKNNPIDSRGYPDKPFNWLRELLPAKLSCRVLAFNYDSAWISNAPQQRLSNISDNLLESLRISRDTKQATSRPLIFIGHSFGGNVIEQALVSATRHGSEYLPIAESTVGVIFLGTPHRGSPAAAWGTLIASLAPPGFVTEDRLLKALEQQSGSLADRLRDFSHWLFSESVSVVCAFEQLATDYSSRAGFVGKFIPSKGLVVTESSACIDGHRKISLHTDHLKMNKFYGPDDPSFKLVYPQIVRMAESADGRLRRRRKPERIPTNEASTSGDLRKCLQKMRVRNPGDVLSDIQRQKGRRVGQTCEWILKRDEFSIWSASEEPRFLRLIGSPGIGKTMMSTFLVLELKTKVEKSPGKTFAYFFCDDKDQNRKTPTAILRSLIWQLLLQRHELFQHVQPDFEKHADDHVFEDLFNNFSALWRILQRILQDERAGEVFILIDALDECESSTRENLLVEIKQLFPSSPCGGSGRIKLLITCRPGISDIERQLRVVDTSLRMDSAKINNDLSEYIDIRVNEITDMDGREYPPVLKKKVRSALKDKAGGTFLWVSLMLADLGGVMMSKVEEKLKDLPQGLDDTYATILDRIPSGNRETAQFILRCMVAARCPLRKSEIQTAYATWKTGSVQCGEDLEVYADILSVCSSILYVGSGDDATLNFCHQSVKDFLLHETSAANTWYHSTEDEAHLSIFKACWAYLSAEEFNGGNLVVSREKDQKGEFLRAKTWQLQDQFSQHLFLQYSSYEWENHAIASYPALLGGGHEQAIDATKAPTLRDTWLLRTAEEGQDAVAKLLLDKGAEVDSKDTYGRTPLLWASKNGHEAVVKLLVEKGADVDSKNSEYGRTPLSLAAGNGHEAVVKLLVEKGAEVDSKDSGYGRTPLSLAAGNGHEAVIELLLEKGAEVDSKDSEYGRTPLWWACENRHEAVIELLLEKGAEVNSKDKYGQTPLLWASRNGHEAIIKLLLENRTEVNSKDKYGRTPLLWASLMGHEAIVKILVQKAEVDTKDSEYGRTPLSWASLIGHEAIVKLLVEKGAEVDSKKKHSQTPLLWASVNGHQAIVELLVEKGAEVDSKDSEYSRTPLSWAAWRGHKDVVELLLDKGAEVDSKDKYGRTPLSWASENGHQAVVKLLVKKCAEVNGRTHLS